MTDASPTHSSPPQASSTEPAPTPDTPPKLHKVTDLLMHLIEATASLEQVTIGRILSLFGMRGFACLLLLLSLLNIAIFMIPMISVLFGLAMIVVAVQMVLGFQTPIFPTSIRRYALPRARLVQGVTRFLPLVARVEKYIKPRFALLSDPALSRVHGAIILILAVMVALPIPLINSPPSLAIALLAIGIIQRDGVFIMAGLAVGMWCLVLLRSLSHVAISLIH